MGEHQRVVRDPLEYLLGAALGSRAMARRVLPGALLVAAHYTWPRIEARWREVLGTLGATPR